MNLQYTSTANSLQLTRIEWAAKMILGWLCYWPVMVWPQPWNDRNPFFLWLLSWAGFYAHDNGFLDWHRSLCRKRAVRHSAERDSG